MIIEKDWITKAGLRAICLVVEFDGRKAHRCGYVGVPPDHPLHRVAYHETKFDCHGGLTYSGEDYPVQADLWWFGFDCAHLRDASIEPSAYHRNFEGAVVRTQEYVELECESLALQITVKTHEKT